jgi:aryl-alcohol dehydrogenase-like predicted oxidoreductase
MDKVRLGRTGAEVSVVGLGCGGHSRLGMARGASTEQAARIVRLALDLGITFIDTALVYGTEEAVGLGIEGRRDQVFLSTKATPGHGGRLLSAAELAENLNGSLKRLRTDHVDVYHLHGVAAAHYSHAVKVLLPELKRLQEKGKIRYLGITEVFAFDTRHEMLARALPENHFDVIMVGFNLLNPSARRSVFPLTRAHDVGTLIMFAVRRALSQDAALRELVAGLLARNEIPSGSVNRDDPLDFVREAPGVRSLVEAAYRFCRHEPGAHVVLTGTGDEQHLKENIQSIQAPAMPAALQERLRSMLGDVDSVSGN